MTYGTNRTIETSRFNWRPTEGSWDAGAVLIADAGANATIRLFIEDFDDEVRPVIAVEETDEDFHRIGWYATDDCRTWTDLERFIPRAEWPAEINVGQRGPRWRHPDPAVVQAINTYRQELAVLIAEAEDEDD